MSDYTCLSISSSGSVLIAETDCSNASTVGWVANPNGRGTVSLVLSCTLTLGLCVWSAMHLNIPPPTDTEWQIWRRNVRWTFMGVFGPELVMYVAWRQWSSSKALSAKVQECVSNHIKPLQSKQGIGSEKGEQPEPIHPWTLMHSFYASMGGFVFDLDPSDEYPAFFPGCQRLTLTARGVALIAKLGHLPNINKDDIADKSKADGLAKAFVCLQAAWVVIQVISRCIVGLPITLLEVNTLGHAFCAFVIYILWWNKPRLIDQPTVLRGDWVRPICAYMYMNSEMSGWQPANTNIIRKSWKDPEFNTLVLCAGSGDVSQANKTIIKTGVGLVSEDLVGSTPESIRTLGTDDCTLQEATSVPEMANITKFPIKVSPLAESAQSEHFVPRPRTLSEAEEGSTSTNPREQSSEEKSMQVRRRQLASEALQRYPILRERFSPIHHDPQASHPQYFTPTVEELLTRYSSNWPSPTLLKRSDAEGKKMGMVLWCASMAYGAVHVAAWNYYFPSRVEAILWRFSAITISGSGLIWLLINGLAHKSRYWNAYWGRFVKMRCSWFSYTIIGFMSAVCGLAYVLSRIFLVVEAFVSIRRLPLAAYATPDWIEAIPHL